MRPTSDRDAIITLAASAPAEPWRTFSPSVPAAPEIPEGPAAERWDLSKEVQELAAKWLRDPGATPELEQKASAETFVTAWTRYYLDHRNWREAREIERLKQWPVFYAHAVLEIIDRSLVDPAPAGEEEDK